MPFQYRPKPWLPYLVAIIGMIVTGSVFYIIQNQVLEDVTFISAQESYHPWAVLIVGIFFTGLLVSVIYIAQVAQIRAIILKQMNENLKNEIADRIHAEETKQKLEVALLQGQKLQSIGTLAGGIAHDFNNILYAIIGYTEISRDDVPKDSLVYKNLGKVLSAAHRGQELIARILAFSRRQHHEFEVINLRSTIEAALSLLQPTIPASVIIHFHPKLDMEILGNQTQLHQVLVNIITNAVDAMEGEGTITIKMKSIAAQDDYLKQFPKIQSVNYCKIDITDTGHGMDQQTLERIFEPFYTTKEVGKGTGLGMSIVHTIIKEHGGEISIMSQLGHGTTFTILLPEHVSH